ncbi:MAG: type IX secretion system protein PorQ, partial [Bacteroidota bacterium]|nr:type IX secretion system protein PorQ [Bacteroidota bacterium]
MNPELYTKRCGVIVAGVIQPGRRNKLLLFCWIACVSMVSAQRGGERVFEFVNLHTSARSTALGGSQIAAWTDDFGLAGGNPAMLQQSMNNSFSFQHNFHFASVDNGYFGYARHMPSLNATVQGGLHYVAYGEFTAADEMGNVSGTFKANELAIQAGISKVFNERISAGILLQYVQSTLETYQSNGFVVDAGMSYQSEDALNHYALVVRGSGVQLSKYYPDDERGRMPVDVQIGYSKRLQYVPFRLSILMHDLNRWDLRYEGPLDENTGTGFGEEPRE